MQVELPDKRNCKTNQLIGRRSSCVIKRQFAWQKIRLGNESSINHVLVQRSQNVIKKARGVQSAFKKAPLFTNIRQVAFWGSGGLNQPPITELNAYYSTVCVIEGAQAKHFNELNRLPVYAEWILWNYIQFVPNSGIILQDFQSTMLWIKALESIQCHSLRSIKYYKYCQS